MGHLLVLECFIKENISDFTTIFINENVLSVLLNIFQKGAKWSNSINTPYYHHTDKAASILN